MLRWSADYVNERIGRFQETLSKLPDQLSGIRDGRTMPAPQSLTIGYARRMHVVVLFFDIVSFTKRVAASSSEEVLLLLNAVIPEVMYIVRDWGGVVEKNTGDGIMAYFGTETTDLSVMAKNAIDAATTVRYAVNNWLNDGLRRLGVPPVKYRIGMDMGEVLVARIGIHSLNHLVAIGEAANMASKLQEIAAEDGIYLGTRLYLNLPDWEQKYCVLQEVPRNWPHTWDFGTYKSFPYMFYSYSAAWKAP